MPCICVATGNQFGLFFIFAQTARAKLIAFCDDQTLEPGPWKGEIYIVNVTRSRYTPWNEPQKEIPLKIGH